MKKLKYLLLLLLLLLCLAAQTGLASSTTMKFVTLGNCYTCKIRIETAVNKLIGVESVKYDIENDFTSVIFFNDMIDIYKIMHAVANVGHDTEWFRAPDSAYDSLRGTCCEYTRTIDYTKVKVGYLSLMDLWLFDNEQPKQINFISAYPTVITDGFLSVNQNTNSYQHLQLSIVSLDGKTMISRDISPNPLVSVDLGNISKGFYLVAITEDKKLIYKTKILIQ